VEPESEVCLRGGSESGRANIHGAPERGGGQSCPGAPLVHGRRCRLLTSPRAPAQGEKQPAWDIFSSRSRSLVPFRSWQGHPPPCSGETGEGVRDSCASHTRRCQWTLSEGGSGPRLSCRRVAAGARARPRTAGGASQFSCTRPMFRDGRWPGRPELPPSTSEPRRHYCSGFGAEPVAHCL
jgi:hypothetical protein